MNTDDKCWTCCGEGYVIRKTERFGKIVVKCPQCENRRLILEHKEKLRKEGKTHAR